MESNKQTHPIDINVLRAYAVVQIADALAQLIEHFGRLQRGRKTVLLFTIHLILDKSTVYVLKSQAASGIEGASRCRYAARAGVRAQNCLPITKLELILCHITRVALLGLFCVCCSCRSKVWRQTVAFLPVGLSFSSGMKNNFTTTTKHVWPIQKRSLRHNW